MKILLTIACVCVAAQAKEYFIPTKVAIDPMTGSPLEPEAKLKSPTPDLSKIPQEELQNLKPMYESDLVDVEARVFLRKDECPTPSTVKTGRVDTSTVMKVDVDTLRRDKLMFLMLNGENEGIYVSWPASEGCLYQATYLAGATLGANLYWLGNGLRLYSQNGKPLKNLDEVDAVGRKVHVLLDDQLWIWPGIEIGHSFEIENGIKLKTISLEPRVFDVEGFFTEEEAAKIIEYGEKGLSRSLVEGPVASSYGKSLHRTSHTAFLPDIHFTRDFRSRSTKLARLPSSSYAENLQLVRYEHGQYYRRHLDTFHAKKFLPPGLATYDMNDYFQWCQWAAGRIYELGDRIPVDFRPGNKYFPNVSDPLVFPNNLLEIVWTRANERNFFEAIEAPQWKPFLREHLNNHSSHLINGMTGPRGHPALLPYVIKTWEDLVQVPELLYTSPKRTFNSVSHYYKWIRTMKEHISALKDSLPREVHPAGRLYPRVDGVFMVILQQLLIQDYSREFLSVQMNPEWVNWFYQNQNQPNTLLQVLNHFPTFLELVIRTWENHANAREKLSPYRVPFFVQTNIPQRFVTLFLYLNDVEDGGETVFPYASEFLGARVNRTQMQECAMGLVVPPKKLHASFFYVQNAKFEADYFSRHGGCPPEKGIKWGANSFMWTSPAEEGSSAHR